MNALLKLIGWVGGVFFGLCCLILLFDGGNFLFSLLGLAISIAILPPISSKLTADNGILTCKQSSLTLFGVFLALVCFVIAVPKVQTDTPKESVATISEPQVQESATTPTTETTETVETVEAQTPQSEPSSAEPVVTSVAPALMAVPTPPATSQYDVSCRIVGVTDGDTATCLTADKQQIKIRMDQIDAPEIGQDFGSASKRALSDMIYGKEVELDTKEQDKYGRTVAEIYVDGQNVNKMMVALGMAWAYREYMRDAEYETLETQARRQSQGLWSQPNAIYPSDYRRGKWGEQSAPVQTRAIEQQQERRDLSDSQGQCGSKRTCKQMSSCAEARHYLNVCGLDRLDRDNDGIPCESLCKR